MKSILGSVAFIAMMSSTAALAQPVDNSARAMNIATLEVATRIAPSDGGAYAELGAAYWRAGRTADAANAYRRVLALDNVMLETRTGDAVWSHTVARMMLARTVQTSDARN